MKNFTEGKVRGNIKIYSEDSVKPPPPPPMKVMCDCRKKKEDICLVCKFFKLRSKYENGN